MAFSILSLAILGDFFLEADVIVTFADVTFSSSHPQCVSFLSFFLNRKQVQLKSTCIFFLRPFFFFGLESFCFRGNLSLNISLKFFSGFM